MTLCVYVIPRREKHPNSRLFWDKLASLWASKLMALCVRKLDRKVTWDDPRKDEPWLGPNDLRADALSDLLTDANKLSVWVERDEVSLRRILAAVAAKRDLLVKLDFIVFDFAILGQIGIEHEQVAGDTQDSVVNACHVDLVQLTAEKLSNFGSRIRAARKAERYQHKTVAQLIQDSLDRGFIDRNLLKPAVAAKMRAP